MSESETRGMLTEADKEWLRGDREYEQRQTAAQRRAKIRDRVKATMQDFSCLIEHWPEKERRKTMEEIDLEECGNEMIAFLYLAMADFSRDPELVLENGVAEEALSFRRALASGIHRSKTELGENPPDTILLDCNTELFELPSEDELRTTMDTDDWRDANEYTRGATDQSDDAAIEKSEAERDVRMAMHAEIEQALYHRRQQSDSEIKRHEEYPGSMGFL